MHSCTNKRMLNRRRQRPSRKLEETLRLCLSWRTWRLTAIKRFRVKSSTSIECFWSASSAIERRNISITTRTGTMTSKSKTEAMPWQGLTRNLRGQRGHLDYANSAKGLKGRVRLHQSQALSSQDMIPTKSERMPIACLLMTYNHFASSLLRL